MVNKLLLEATTAKMFITFAPAPSGEQIAPVRLRPAPGATPPARRLPERAAEPHDSAVVKIEWNVVVAIRR